MRLAHVTPFPLDDGHEVARHVRRATEALAARGHQVLVVAPSHSADAVQDARSVIKAGGDLLPAPGEPPRVLAVGEALAALPGRGRPALPIDVSRTIADLLEAVELDVCHVHDPFAPSVPSAALRHSRALNAGTFHLPIERGQVGRRVVELVLGRLDLRLASWDATAAAVARTYPASYEVLAPGADGPDGHANPSPPAPLRIAFLEREERPALRTFLRALRELGTETAWEARIVGARGASATTPLRAELRERVAFRADGDGEALAWADVAVFASAGALPAPGALLEARAAGCAVLAARLPVYEEAAPEALLFEPGDVTVLAQQLGRLARDAELRGRAAGTPPPGWDAHAAQLEAAYERLVARRHDPAPPAHLRKRLAERPLIDVDLHMHTDHSHDCATPVESLLEAARRQGLGAIAVTDHNVITGAFEAAEKAERFGVKVIVGEEVKTASQGEVIGLFLEEHIPRGMTLAETVAEIRRQGGVVYVPHPFDRMHSVPDYEHLLDIVDEVDAIEVYNARVAIGTFNDEARRFAEKYRLAAGAGSDAHVTAGLGSVRVRMRDFDGPEEFMASLRDAELHTNPASLLYVQALKFLETKATPSGAREAVKRRRVARATRKP